jgi:hypothetical protein
MNPIPNLPSSEQIQNDIAILRYVLALVQSPEARRDIRNLIIDRHEQLEVVQNNSKITSNPIELVEACETFRDAVLNQRHQLEEPCLDSSQTNAVLDLYDEVIGKVIGE